MVTPAIQMNPGWARSSENYESNERGKGRVDGFERFDGRPKPSKASYWIIGFDAGVTEVSAGDIVTGASSSVTGEALIDGVLTSGSYAGNDAAGHLVLVNVSGVYTDNENLQVSSSTRCVADGVTAEKGADTDVLHNAYMQDAIETTRTDILVVPTSSGNILGGFVLGGASYCFRNNAGGTAADMYKESATGWTKQVLGETMNFTSGGTTAIAEGNTVTGASSTRTAVVKRVIVTSGAWADGDAAGRLIVYSVSGAFSSGEGLEVGSVNLATLTADAVVNTLAANGRFDVVVENFGGHAGTRAAYGCDGVSLGFEWDGSVFTPIVTGMTVDKPIRVFVHKHHLFFAFTGGSVQHSGLTDPYSWSVITGASELGIGAEITGFLKNTTNALSSALTIFARDKIFTLYGSSTADWELVELSDEAGAIAWTPQLINKATYMDDIGLRTLETGRAYGDFSLGTLSTAVQPVFNSKKEAGTEPTASLRVKSKDQYRLFWSDGTGMTMYLGREYPELMAFDWGLTVKAVWAGEDSSGNEIMFFGSTDGYVYQIDSGTSFDGAAISAFCRLPFNHVGSPSHEKQWFKAVLETSAAVTSVIGVIAELEYGDPDEPISDELSFDVSGGGGYWNEDNWNEFYWSSQAEGIAEIDIDGEGANVSLILLSSQVYEESHTHHGLTLHFSQRRLQQ